MKLLLISTCQEKLSEREFVHPISKILDSEQHQILHYTECTHDIIHTFDKIIICGTSLKDNEYAENIDIFKKLFDNFQGSLLGICSGMHIVGSIFGGKLIQNLEIGMTLSETLEENELCNGQLEVYNIHTKSIDELPKFIIIAKNGNSTQIIKHKTKNIFGVSFHPEVRNEEIIFNFLKI
ncbi:MAG: hypothetical protein MK206_02705 [Candidatus Poseidoniia archaeon]|nr:hypothetical protein [Candidatus Poseidoniia archaeon]